MVDNIFSSFLNLSFVFKIFLLVITGGFTIFCLVVVNQIRVMNRIIDFGFLSYLLFLIGAVFVVLAASLFLLGLVIL